MKKQNKTSAFTLAEVLITLAIIGIVASLTISSLVLKYQQDRNVVVLKSVYSTLSNTFNRARIKYGEPRFWDVDGENWTTTGSDSFITKYMEPYMHMKYRCKNRDGCGHEIHKLNGNSQTMGSDAEGGSDVKFIMPNGAKIILLYKDYEYTHAVDILADVNGAKKPNVWGKDVFYMSLNLDNGKFSFYGYDTKEKNIETITENNSGCNKEETGQACGKLIQQFGWRVPTIKEYVDAGGQEALYPW